MSTATRRAALRIIPLLVVPAMAWGQFPSEIVGFNGPPIDDESAREMFRLPSFSGTTVDYIVPDADGAFRASGFQTEGVAALEVFFTWNDTADPNAWVRLSTFNGAERPNPALDTRGKVRVKFTNVGLFGFGQISLCLGIRETGALVPQLTDGGSTGDIEWVGVDTTVNAIIAGADMIVNTTAAGDDVQEYVVGFDLTDLPTGTAVISPGVNGVIDTTPAGDDAARFGYFLGGPDGDARIPIPAVVLPEFNPLPNTLEWDLATGEVWLNGVSQGGGITGFTGNGTLADSPNDRGTLEHIALINVPTDDEAFVRVVMDELQFEATETDPVLPPQVIWPIIVGDTEVTVTDLMFTVDQVTLLRNDSPVQTVDVTSDEDVVFTISPAVAGDIYTATQRDGTTGTVSDPSDGVEVLPFPPPYTFSLLIDETGEGSCATGGWEFVGVTSVSGWSPIGQPLFTSDGVWQTVDVPLDDPSLIKASAFGDGTLEDSETGIYTIDSLWFTLTEGSDLGPWVAFIDAVQVLDEFGQVSDTILDMEDGVNRLQRVRGQSGDETGLISSDLSTAASYDGVTSHRLEWEYDGTDPESIGMLQRIGYTCGTSAEFDHNSTAVRFHLLLRGAPTAPDVPLPGIVGPMVAPQSTVQVTCDGTATSLQLYVNGVATGAPVDPAGATEVDFTGLALVAGDSVSATQVVGGVTSDLAFPRVVLSVPPAPTVVPPIFPGELEATVTNVSVAPHAVAEWGLIYRDGELAGAAAGGTETVVVPVSLGGAFVENQAITATQIIREAESDPSDAVVVGIPGPTLFKAPAQGDAFIRVLDLNPSAVQVEVRINDGASSFTADVSGEYSVEVPVSGLVAGDTVTARMFVGEVPSGESAPETVTAAVATSIFCDDFEYSEAAYEAAWATTTYERLELVDTMNATPGGQKSLWAFDADTRVDKQIDPLTPTATDPVVVNFNIYDGVGVGNPAVQFIQLTGDLDAGDFFLMEAGILGWADTDNVHYDLRVLGNGGPNWVDMDEFEAPDRSVGWHNITVVHKGDRIDAYVDGLLSIKNLTLSEETIYEFARIGAAPFSSGTAYFDDYCVEVGPVRFLSLPPSPPRVESPIIDGDTVVTVSGVATDATLLQIRDESATVIGSYTDPIPGDGMVTINLTRSLVHLERITARVTNAVGTSDSPALEVGNGSGDILVCIGIRETGDAGALGTPGGSSGEIEWVGASSVVDGAPQGVPLSATGEWVTLTFDPLSDPIGDFTGDGAITATRGTLEHLAVAVNAASSDRSTGPYLLFVDNVTNVGADTGGSDFVITDFESFAIDDEVLFQEPTFSGTTAMHVSFPPSFSGVSAAYGNPGQSEFLSWFWVDTLAERWVRITTNQVSAIPQPIIDLTKPIRMDVLLALELGPELCAGDLNCDGIVDFDDIDPFVAALGCQGGDPNCWDPNCPWLNGDTNGDETVDFDDIDPFVARIGATCP